MPSSSTECLGSHATSRGIKSDTLTITSIQSYTSLKGSDPEDSGHTSLASSSEPAWGGHVLSRFHEGTLDAQGPGGAGWGGAELVA